MSSLTEQEVKVTQVALDLLVTRLDGLPLQDEDEIFGDVVEAFGEQVMMEGEAIQAVISIKGKLEGAS